MSCKNATSNASQKDPGTEAVSDLAGKAMTYVELEMTAVGEGGLPLVA